MPTIKFCRVIGREDRRKSHILSSLPYIVEIIPLSRKPAYQDEIVLHLNYLEKGLSVKEMSVLLGCKPTTIKFYLKRYGIRKSEKYIRHRANLRYGEKLFKSKVQTHKTEERVKNAIVKMYSEKNLSLRAIADILNEMKVPTKKQGKAWGHSVIREILKRENLYQPRRKT